MSSTPQDTNAFHAGKSPNGQQRTDATGVPPQLTVCQSRPHCLRRFYHARTVTGREYHCSLCRLWRNREPPDILSRYLNAHHLSSLFCLSAGLGVPLHTLMLIAITKRKYLANGYSVVKELSRFRHTKENRVKAFALHPIVPENTLNIRCSQNIFQFFSEMPHTEVYRIDR